MKAALWVLVAVNVIMIFTVGYDFHVLTRNVTTQLDEIRQHLLSIRDATHESLKTK